MLTDIWHVKTKCTLMSVALISVVHSFMSVVHECRAWVSCIHSWRLTHFRTCHSRCLFEMPNSHVTWLIRIWRATHSYVTQLMQVSRNSLQDTLQRCITHCNTSICDAR